MHTAHADGQRESMSLQHTPKDNTNSTNIAPLGKASSTVNPRLKVDYNLGQTAISMVSSTLYGVCLAL